MGGGGAETMTLLCGSSKAFMKTLKAFIKPFEVPHGSKKIKINYLKLLFQYNLYKCTGREGLKRIIFSISYER